MESFGDMVGGVLFSASESVLLGRLDFAAAERQGLMTFRLIILTSGCYQLSIAKFGER